MREGEPILDRKLAPKGSPAGMVARIPKGMRAFAIEVFNRHNEQVRRDVPADRLQVYEISQGWGPLCAFLGVPVPEGKPFPHLNDAAEFRARIERGARALRTIGAVALVLAALAAAALAVAIVLAVASLGNS